MTEQQKEKIKDRLSYYRVLREANANGFKNARTQRDSDYYDKVYQRLDNYINGMVFVLETLGYTVNINDNWTVIT